MKKKNYDRKRFKEFITIGIPALVSVIGVILSLIKTMPFYVKITLIIINLLLLLVLFFALYYYSKQEIEYSEQEKKYKKTIQNLKSNLCAKNAVVTTYTLLTERWGDNIYEFANLIKKNEVTNRSWDKQEYYKTICLGCSDMIHEYCHPEERNLKKKNISVNFVEYTTDENGLEYIELVADSNPSEDRPQMYKKKERLEDSRFYYAEMIRDHKGLDVAKDNSEILKRFNKTSLNTDLSKYTQYIAIPILCSNNKLLGIFQVVTEYNCKIELDEESLRDFAKDKVIPYTHLMLLVDKIHKGLYARPI